MAPPRLCARLNLCSALCCRLQAEEDWEKNRDSRVTNWRQFQKHGRKRNLKLPKLTETDDDKTYIKRVKLRGPAPQILKDPNEKD
jgi:hypothetical protein